VRSRWSHLVTHGEHGSMVGKGRVLPGAGGEQAVRLRLSDTKVAHLEGSACGVCTEHPQFVRPEMLAAEREVLRDGDPGAALRCDGHGVALGPEIDGQLDPMTHAGFVPYTLDGFVAVSVAHVDF